MCKITKSEGVQQWNGCVKLIQRKWLEKGFHNNSLLPLLNTSSKTCSPLLVSPLPPRCNCCATGEGMPLCVQRFLKRAVFDCCLRRVVSTDVLAIHEYIGNCPLLGELEKKVLNIITFGHFLCHARNLIVRQHYVKQHAFTHTYVKFEESVFDTHTIQGRLRLCAVWTVGLGENHHLVVLNGPGCQWFDSGGHCWQTFASQGKCERISQNKKWRHADKH